MRGVRSRRSSAPSATCCSRASRAAASTLPPAQGTYFQLADYSRLAGPLAGCSDVEFTERLINEAGVAVIPLSPFYREPPAGMRIVRLCVAKRDETLIEAADRISAYTAALR